MPKDAADLHVERWRDSFIDLTFDDEVEAMTVRVGQVVRHLRAATRLALAETGLQDFEYETLHHLMIRDTPGHASPGTLAADLGLSNAGMTGRLEGLETKGWVKRIPGITDRRRVDVEITREGARIWREALAIRGAAEDDLAAALTRKELATLNRMLKKLTLHIEAGAGSDDR
ncbi:MarR family winged helix-turn-helix transcriptional regulator [Nocardioides sp.]|uniref:MarR family winged helix-turn-helix transcriptional regulator n=1 Tax=Nocardioides sp. TaxID=35761 RepID=UPI003D14BBC0